MGGKVPHGIFVLGGKAEWVEVMRAGEETREFREAAHG
jgi:hypothetical protein